MRRHGHRTQGFLLIRVVRCLMVLLLFSRPESTSEEKEQKVCGSTWCGRVGKRFLLSGVLMQNPERCLSLQKSSCGYIKLSPSPGGGIQGECVVMREVWGDLPFLWERSVLPMGYGTPVMHSTTAMLHHQSGHSFAPKGARNAPLASRVSWSR